MSDSEFGPRSERFKRYLGDEMFVYVSISTPTRHSENKHRTDMDGERSDTGHVKNWLASPRCQKRSPHNQQGILPLCRAISSDSKCHYCKASAIRPSPFNPSNYSVGDAPDGLSKFAQHLSQIRRSRAKNVRVFFCWDLRGKSLSANIKR